jgi:hypothetical protein
LFTLKKLHHGPNQICLCHDLGNVVFWSLLRQLDHFRVIPKLHELIQKNAIFILLCRNAPASVNHGTQYTFALGTSDWSFSGSSSCPSGVSTCYNVESVSITVDSGASVSSSYSWSGSSSRTLTVSATVSNRLGPVSVTYAVVVRQYEERTLSQQASYQDYYYCHYTYSNGEPVYGRVSACGCCETIYYTQYYQSRVDLGTTSMSATANLLLLPTGVTVYTQPASSVTAASTTNIAVTLQLSPAVTVTNGHPFTAEKTSVSESGWYPSTTQNRCPKFHDPHRCID